MPFFLPIAYYDTRVQLLDNVSYARGDHFFKAGAEWNRVESVQTFIGFADGRFIFDGVNGFLNYVANGPGYVECSDGTSSTTGACPSGGVISRTLGGRRGDGRSTTGCAGRRRSSRIRSHHLSRCSSSRSSGRL